MLGACPRARDEVRRSLVLLARACPQNRRRTSSPTRAGGGCRRAELRPRAASGASEPSGDCCRCPPGPLHGPARRSTSPPWRSRRTRASSSPRLGWQPPARSTHAQPPEVVRPERELHPPAVELVHVGAGQVDQGLGVLSGRSRSMITLAFLPPSTCTATIVDSSQSQRCASTDGAPASRTSSGPKPVSGHFAPGLALEADHEDSAAGAPK